MNKIQKDMLILREGKLKKSLGNRKFAFYIGWILVTIGFFTSFIWGISFELIFGVIMVFYGFMSSKKIEKEIADINFKLAEG